MPAFASEQDSSHAKIQVSRPARAVNTLCPAQKVGLRNAEEVEGAPWRPQLVAHSSSARWSASPPEPLKRRFGGRSAG